MAWNLEGLGPRERPSVWVVTVFENDTPVQRAAMSLEGIANFLWKRKFVWIDEWHLDDGPDLGIPDELRTLFEGIQLDTMEAAVTSDAWDGHATLGPFGPVVQGVDTGLEVCVHLSRLNVHP